MTTFDISVKYLEARYHTIILYQQVLVPGYLRRPDRLPERKIFKMSTRQRSEINDIFYHDNETRHLFFFPSSIDPFNSFFQTRKAK